MKASQVQLCDHFAVLRWFLCGACVALIGATSLASLLGAAVMPHDNRSIAGVWYAPDSKKHEGTTLVLEPDGLVFQGSGRFMPSWHEKGEMMSFHPKPNVNYDWPFTVSNDGQTLVFRVHGRSLVFARERTR